MSLGGPLDAKALGAFYTPNNVASKLANWVVRNGRERLLEPSVGEGALMLAAIDRARNANSSNLSFLVCDINPAAAACVAPLLTANCKAVTADFLELDPNVTGLFDGVITNPPFTRNHDLPKARRESLRKRFEISGAAGLWVHFLLHAVTFLSIGGRLGAVIPASGLFSQYGRQALTRLAACFKHIEIHQISGRPVWTNGAEERGALFFAEGYKLGSSRLPQSTSWNSSGLASHRSSAFGELASLSVPLSTVADLSIGLVTGCNEIFLLDDSDRRARGIQLKDLQPIVARARHIPGIQIDRAELRTRAEEGQKTWLLAPKTLEVRNTGVRNQLAMISKVKRRNTLWFKKRSPWWKVQLGEPCDAIFTYMNDEGPKLVFARDPLYCTNTLHRIRFKSSVGQGQRNAAALTMISTFGQLAAERLGRSYGGGLLKFELREARSMPVLPCATPHLDECILLVDGALRRGRRDEARFIADEALLLPILGDRFAAVVAALYDELLSCRFERRGNKRSSQLNET